MASQARVRLLVPANAPVAVTRVAAKARHFDKQEFIPEDTLRYDNYSHVHSLSFLPWGLDRVPVLAFHVDQAVAGGCRNGRSFWERFIGSDLTRTALWVFEIINLDQGDARVVASATNDRGVISRRQSHDNG